MKSGDGQRLIAGSDPYQGTGRVIINNTAGSDKVFSNDLPGVDQAPKPAGTEKIYGSNRYVNNSLRGYSQTDQNIISIDELTNGVGQMTPEEVERLRRNNIAQANQDTDQTDSINPNQMYMQPPVIPQIQDMPEVAATTPKAAPPDLTTAEGNVDYLNSIAPEVKPRRHLLPSNKLFVAFGVGIIVMVIVAAVGGAIGNTGGGFSHNAQELGKSLANLQSIADYGDSNANYSSTDLSNITAETKLVMLSHQTSLGDLINLGSVDKKGKETDAKSDKTATDELDKAKANGSLGQAYSKELKDRLTAVAQAASKAYDSTKNSAAKLALSKAYADVQNLIERVNNSSTTSTGRSAD